MVLDLKRVIADLLKELHHIHVQTVEHDTTGCSYGWFMLQNKEAI